MVELNRVNCNIDLSLNELSTDTWFKFITLLNISAQNLYPMHVNMSALLCKTARVHSTKVRRIIELLIIAIILPPYIKEIFIPVAIGCL